MRTRTSSMRICQPGVRSLKLFPSGNVGRPPCRISKEKMLQRRINLHSHFQNKFIGAQSGVRWKTGGYFKHYDAETELRRDGRNGTKPVNIGFEGIFLLSQNLGSLINYEGIDRRLSTAKLGVPTAVRVCSVFRSSTNFDKPKSATLIW